MKNHDIIEIGGEVRHETESSYLFHTETHKVWVPKSQCQWEPDHSVSGNSGTMQMPEWLALDKGLI